MCDFFVFATLLFSNKLGLPLYNFATILKNTVTESAICARGRLVGVDATVANLSRGSFVG